MFAPVVNRFHVYDVPVSKPTRAYMEAIMALPAWKAWIAGARPSPGGSSATRRSRERLERGEAKPAGGAGRAPRPRMRRIGGRRIIAEGLEGNLWKDIYHNAMTVSWPAFIAALAAAFVALNIVFALLYDLGSAPIANARRGSLARPLLLQRRDDHDASATATCIRRRLRACRSRRPRVSSAWCCLR